MDPRHHHNAPDYRHPSPPPPQPHHVPAHHQPSPPPPHHAPVHHQPSPPPPQPLHHAPVHHQPTPQPPVIVTHHAPTHHQPSPAPPQVPIVVHHVSQQTTHHQTPKYTDNKPTVRFYTKAKTNYSLTIRDHQVVLAPSNPSDPHQHWIKEEKLSTRVKDKEGFPSFALVNKATGQALKHATGATKPVQLTEYNPDKVDESVLWTQSKDLGDGFHAVRMVNNIKLNLDASKGEVGIHDGSKVLVWEWTKGDNQRWTTGHICEFLDTNCRI